MKSQFWLIFHQPFFEKDWAILYQLYIPIFAGEMSIVPHFCWQKKHFQWPFQEPKLEVPTICKAYVRGYPQKIWPYMVQYLHYRILKFPYLKLKLHLRPPPCSLTRRSSRADRRRKLSPKGLARAVAGGLGRMTSLFYEMGK